MSENNRNGWFSHDVRSLIVQDMDDVLAFIHDIESGMPRERWLVLSQFSLQQNVMIEILSINDFVGAYSKYYSKYSKYAEQIAGSTNPDKAKAGALLRECMTAFCRRGRHEFDQLRERYNNLDEPTGKLNKLLEPEVDSFTTLLESLLKRKPNLYRDIYDKDTSLYKDSDDVKKTMRKFIEFRDRVIHFPPRFSQSSHMSELAKIIMTSIDAVLVMMRGEGIPALINDMDMIQKLQNARDSVIRLPG